MQNFMTSRRMSNVALLLSTRWTLKHFTLQHDRVVLENVPHASNRNRNVHIFFDLHCTVSFWLSTEHYITDVGIQMFLAFLQSFLREQRLWRFKYRDTVVQCRLMSSAMFFWLMLCRYYTSSPFFLWSERLPLRGMVSSAN